jgi:hypothetical protein
MNHNDLKRAIRSGFGPHVPIDAREIWGRFCEEEETCISLRWDWIHNDLFWAWILNSTNVSFNEGEEWFIVCIGVE